MKDTDIRKYAQLMGELGLTGLEIREQDKVVRLERSGVPVSLPAPEPAAPRKQDTADTGTAVTSPIVGVFYRAPAENAAPYVQVGDQVKPGTVLCLIEAMKMMNEICAETEGVITEICAENGQVVDFGRELFRIRRESDGTQ